MMANEVLQAHGPFGLQFSESVKRLGAVLRPPWPVILVVGLVATAIIEIAGPWRFSVSGRVVSISSAGPLLYALYAVTLVGWLLRPRRSLHTARQLLVRLDSRARSILTFIVFPVGLWMVVPSHTINFVSFLVNRSTGSPVLSLEGLLFYPRIFVGEYSPSPAVGVVALLLAGSALRRLRGTDEVGRVLALALLFSTIAAIVHPYKQPRFFFLTAILLVVRRFAGGGEAPVVDHQPGSREHATMDRRYPRRRGSSHSSGNCGRRRPPAPRPSPTHRQRLCRRGTERRH